MATLGSKVAFGLLFTVLLPGALWLWANGLPYVFPPIPISSAPGFVLVATGALMMVLAVVQLIVHGRGLPMSIAPPTIRVERGLYALVSHPIYVGACVLWCGIACVAASPGAFWAGTPMIVTACWAIVYGYERRATDERLGERARRPLLEPSMQWLRPLWRVILLAAQRLANSWHEWRVGGIRIINHGAYVSAAAVAGALIAGSLLGNDGPLIVSIVCLATIIGAGLWAQVIEGSDMLLRPFGFYGGIIGGAVVCVGLMFMGYDVMLLVAAFFTATPVIQSLGRLRCLVQGCCHGAPCDVDHGIVYHMPRSRVVTAGLGNTPVYPTQVYSVVGNMFTFTLMFMLWSAHAPYAAVIAAYLITNGMFRFVEENYRGEPQTPTFMGLRLYQWLSLSFVVIGMIVAMLPSHAANGQVSVSLPLVGVACAAGVVTWFAMGVDFPHSNRRFSRLAPP